jgi:hypothetical protein
MPSNRGESRRAQLVLGSMGLDVQMPADSLVTLQWS